MTKINLLSRRKANFLPIAMLTVSFRIVIQEHIKFIDSLGDLPTELVIRILSFVHDWRQLQTIERNDRLIARDAFQSDVESAYQQTWKRLTLASFGDLSVEFAAAGIGPNHSSSMINHGRRRSCDKDTTETKSTGRGIESGDLGEQVETDWRELHSFGRMKRQRAAENLRRGVQAQRYSREARAVHPREVGELPPPTKKRVKMSNGLSYFLSSKLIYTPFHPNPYSVHL